VNLTESVSLTDSINYWAPTAWNKKVISINSTMVSGSNLTHLPILVKLTDDTDLSTTSVGAGGVGIRFTSDGTELIDFEIDYYDGDSTDGTVHAWVKVPTLDPDDTTYIYIHYGKTAAQADAAATANNVWAESGESQEYVVVNHFMSALDTDNDTREQIGSVSGDDDDFNTINMDLATDQVLGKIGKALDMNEDSIDERVCLEVDNITNASQCRGENPIFDNPVSVRTASLWYKADDVETRQVLFEEGGESKGQVIYLFDGKIFACTTKWTSECVSTDTTANEWHHVALVWAGSETDGSYLYHDSVQVRNFTGKGNAQHDDASALGNIAQKTKMENGTASGGFSFDGIIDEFRVTDTVLTSAEIQTMYNSESNDDFIKVGVVLSESISFTDSISEAAGVNLTESVSLTDSISKTPGVNLSESVSLTDSVAKSTGLNLSTCQYCISYSEFIYNTSKGT